MLFVSVILSLFLKKLTFSQKGKKEKSTLFYFEFTKNNQPDNLVIYGSTFFESDRYLLKFLDKCSV
jgi:hypothetical protein